MEKAERKFALKNVDTEFARGVNRVAVGIVERVEISFGRACSSAVLGQQLLGEQSGGLVHRHRPILNFAISVQSVLDVSRTAVTHQIDIRMMLRGVWSIHQARENTKGLHFPLTLSSSL